MSKSETIDNREKGEAPLSIGTSLALESLCGFGEFPNKKPFIENIDELWVNVRTVYRNFYNSIERYVRETAVVMDLINYFVEDLSVLKTTIENKSFGRVKVRFYFPTYKESVFKRHYPNAIRKNPKTPKQIFEHQLEEDVLKVFIENQDYQVNLDLMTCDYKFKESGRITCLLTHYPVDLLNSDNFIKLWLLESHTGSIKGREKWYTKLTGGNKLDEIPFNRLTMQVLGDGNTLFSAMNRNTKEALLSMAEDNNWTSVTTMEKVKYSIGKLKNTEQRTFFKSLL